MVVFLLLAVVTIGIYAIAAAGPMCRVASSSGQVARNLAKPKDLACRPQHLVRTRKSMKGMLKYVFGHYFQVIDQYQANMLTVERAGPVSLKEDVMRDFPLQMFDEIMKVTITRHDDIPEGDIDRVRESFETEMTFLPRVPGRAKTVKVTQLIFKILSLFEIPDVMTTQEEKKEDADGSPPFDNIIAFTFARFFRLVVDSGVGIVFRFKFEGDWEEEYHGMTDRPAVHTIVYVVKVPWSIDDVPANGKRRSETN